MGMEKLVVNERNKNEIYVYTIKIHAENNKKRVRYGKRKNTSSTNNNKKDNRIGE